VVDAHWWRSFGSGELDALIEEAQSRNQDLATALARVDAARARARIAGAALAPDLSGRLDAAREARMGGRADVDGNTSFVGFAASYELDLWGRRGALHQEALKGLRASEFDRDAVRLGVTAEVASSWLQLRGLREREAIARDNVANAARVLQLVEARSRAGAVTPLDLAQQRGLVAARQRELAALQRQANDAETALALLLGAPALPPALRAGRERGRTRSGRRAPRLASLQMPSIEAGIPALALTRRPDIARAEARLAAADANLQAARAALLPGVNLSATIGLQGQAPGRLIDNPLYSLAAGVVAPIFDGGRLRGRTRPVRSAAQRAARGLSGRDPRRLRGCGDRAQRRRGHRCAGLGAGRGAAAGAPRRGAFGVALPRGRRDAAGAARCAAHALRRAGSCRAVAAAAPAGARCAVPRARRRMARRCGRAAGARRGLTALRPCVRPLPRNSPK
jgi:NodT family efflux transporter outer membrane factor (OMF) lipoprotein